jgi:TolA-binding protein
MDRTLPPRAGASRASALLALALTAAGGCASAKPRPDAEPALPAVTPPPAAEIRELRDEVGRLSDQVRRLETELAQTRAAGGAKKPTPNLPTRQVKAGPADLAGIEPEPAAAPGDPEAGLERGEAVRAYRQAMIGMRTKKHSDAVLAFSAFLERYPEHALAGNAQFHLGEAYYQQGENRLAETEFERLTAAYPASPFLAHALTRLVQIAEGRRDDSSARTRRELLERLFPDSPALTLAARSPTAPAASTTAPAEPPARPPTLDEPPASPDEVPAASPEGSAAPSWLDEPPVTAPTARPVDRPRNDGEKLEQELPEQNS